MRAAGMLPLLVALAAFAATASGSPAVTASAQGCGENAQWEITGPWRTVQSNNYTVVWKLTQKATKLSGSALLSQDEARKAGYASRVGEVAGSLVGNRFDAIISWHRPGNVVARGRYVGTIEPAGTGRGKVEDGRGGAVSSPTAITWTGSGEATCSEWPPLVDPLIEDIADVSNGCGPGAPSNDPRTWDTSTYPQYPRTNPGGPKKTVDFRAACNLHDAGYSGAVVRDVLHGNRRVDFFNLTKDQIDLKFLRDMQLICTRTLDEPGWGVALANCKGSGGSDAFGAQSRYDLVHTASAFVRSWKERPELNGTWTGAGGTWQIRQLKRQVTATWQDGGRSGEFRGIIVTHDSTSVVEGHAKAVDGSKRTEGGMRLLFSPALPDQLRVAGELLSGKIARS